MKLSKRKALTICRDLWKYVEKNSGKNKRRWEGWIKYGFMENDCPCCEYIGHHERVNNGCKKCPLFQFWNKNRKRKRIFYPCEEVLFSPFRKWRNAGNRETEIKYARIIWKACVKELKKLERNKHG